MYLRPMHLRPTLCRLTPILSACCLLACSKAEQPQAASPAVSTPASIAAPVVTIVASDFRYDAPDTIAAGMVTLRLVNKGPELHHVTLLRFTGGKTLADFQAGLQEMKPGAPPPPWVESLGGPNAPAPGGEMLVTQELTPGNYGLVCFIPSADHMPHFAKGMVRALTVIPSTSAVAATPAADIRIAMTDYAWDVAPAITSGKHIIRLENLASQGHEMFIVRLDKGKTPLQVAQWTENPVGPPPGIPLGGTANMDRGVVTYVPVDLSPGEYALLCFIPDVKDGKAHYLHGMMQAFTVT